MMSEWVLDKKGGKIFAKLMSGKPKHKTIIRPNKNKVELTEKQLKELVDRVLKRVR